eukprot:233496-Pelagomonas_calceolata.AAC.2
MGAVDSGSHVLLLYQQGVKARVSLFEAGSDSLCAKFSLRFPFPSRLQTWKGGKRLRYADSYTCQEAQLACKL